jgi:HEAT repeat protein
MAAASSADPKARADAARALSSDPPPSLLPDLERLAHDPDAGVSSAAFQALRESSPERALELAREGLRSTDPEQRSAAAERAGQLDTEAARPLMIEALRDPDAAVVVQAASWLGSAGGTDAQQALLDVLEARTSTDEERRAAAQALETMGGAAARDHADLLERWRAEPEEESTGDDDESP